MIAARVIKDSLNVATGKRLTTIIARFHRFILPEVGTHRMFSRNTASSRAIPIAKQIQQIKENPAIPIFWGKAQPGMSAYESLENELITPVEIIWQRAMQRAIGYATELNSLGLHKQLTNRLIEPYMWTTMYISSTTWDNFFMLRRPPGGVMDPQFPAQPEMQQLAIEIYNAIQASQPEEKEPGRGIKSWHIPFITDSERTELESQLSSGSSELQLSDILSISAGRAARVSYGNTFGFNVIKSAQGSINERQSKRDVQTGLFREGAINTSTNYSNLYSDERTKRGGTKTERPGCVLPTEDERSGSSDTGASRTTIPTESNDYNTVFERDLSLGRRLAKDRHMSPFEHSAQCLAMPSSYGNFQGWVQHRWYIERDINPVIDT